MTPPDFPPLIAGHPVPRGADPLQAAVAGARGGRLGAGDLCWSGDRDSAVAALILEPEGARDEALQMVPLMAVAVCDALAHVGPPNLAIGLGWPATFLANGGAVGEVSVALPEGSDPASVPDWLVVSVRLSLRLPAKLRAAPGHAAGVTALHEEGGGDITSGALIGAIARHFLARLDGWQHEGFGPVAAALFGRLGPAPEVDGIPLIGVDDGGSAVLDGGARRSLASAMGIAA